MASLRVQLCPNTVVPFGVSARCAARRGREAQDEPEDDGEERALFDKIRELYNAGKTVSAIAREVGFGRKSVDRWVRLLVLPVRTSMMPKTQSTPAYHEAFLLRRWAARLHWLLQSFSEAPCAVEGSRHPPNA